MEEDEEPAGATGSDAGGAAGALVGGVEVAMSVSACSTGSNSDELNARSTGEVIQRASHAVHSCWSKRKVEYTQAKDGEHDRQLTEANPAAVQAVAS